MKGDPPTIKHYSQQIQLLRSDFEESNWTVNSVEELLGSEAMAAMAREQFTPARIVLENDDSSIAILTKLFLLAEEVSKEQLRIAFPRADIRILGLVKSAENGMYKATMDLRPYSFEDHDWWIVSDLGEAQTGEPIHPDHVLGIGQATLSLLRMTIREPVEEALDLGTGCGILALHLATHSGHVVATDISRRACDLTRFNAELNHIQNIEVLQGSLFEPVKGRKFDLITSNPPFVITPDSVRAQGIMEYRDGQMQRDNLIEKIIHDAPNFLNQNGILQMLANWEIPNGQEWWERPKSWLRVDTQTWLVQRDELDPAEYVEMWLRDSGQSGDQVLYEEWLKDFHAAGTGSVGMGFLVSRHSEPGRLVYEEIVEGELPDGPTAASAIKYLGLPASWRELFIKRTEDVREERHYVPGAEDPQIIMLTQGSAMRRRIRVGSNMSALVGAADGSLTTSQIVTALSSITGEDEEAIWAQIEAALPELLRSGFLCLLDRA